MEISETIDLSPKIEPQVDNKSEALLETRLNLLNSMAEKFATMSQDEKLRYTPFDYALMGLKKEGNGIFSVYQMDEYFDQNIVAQFDPEGKVLLDKFTSSEKRNLPQGDQSEMFYMTLDDMLEGMKLSLEQKISKITSDNR
jgi:hypothetical protein